jgi:uncharacterized protein (TIGR02452 family)
MSLPPLDSRPTSFPIASFFREANSDWLKTTGIALGCLALLAIAYLTIRKAFSADKGSTKAPESKLKIDYFTDAGRLKISKENLSFIKQGFYSLKEKNYPLQSGDTLFTLSSITKHANMANLQAVQAKYEQQITVVKKDSFEVAAEYARNGEKVALLSFAGQETPGGGALEIGSYGLEEELCYRSDIVGFMQQQFNEQLQIGSGNDDKILYPVYDHLIHTPDVTLFRKSAKHSYELMEAPIKMGILTCGVPHNMMSPPLNGVGTGDIRYQREGDDKAIRIRIMNVLKTAYDQNYETVILGAIGCGAYKNPPQVVAKICKEVIDTYFAGAFKNIVFAIIDDHHCGHDHNPEGNFKPFQELFRV